MGWYTCVKKINGRRYLYLQMTYRLGGKVKTKNKYIGPVDGTAFSWEPRSQASISQDREAMRVEAEILKDLLSTHPAKRFLKYRGRTDRQSVGGTSFAELNAQALQTGAKGKYLDTMLSESGFASFEELDESVEEYFSTKQRLMQLREHLATLRTEERYAAQYHRSLGTRQTPESVTREIPEPPALTPPLPPQAKAPKVRTPKPPKPAGGLRIGKIRRLKPQTRAVINREAARRRLEQEARNNLDTMREDRRAGFDVSELRAIDTQYRRTHKLAFGRPLKVRKKKRPPESDL